MPLTRFSCCCEQKGTVNCSLSSLQQLPPHTGSTVALWVLTVHPASLEHSPDKVLEHFGGILWKESRENWNRLWTLPATDIATLCHIYCFLSVAAATDRSLHKLLEVIEPSCASGTRRIHPALKMRGESLRWHSCQDVFLITAVFKEEKRAALKRDSAKSDRKIKGLRTEEYCENATSGERKKFSDQDFAQT